MTERDIFIAALKQKDADARLEYLQAACGPNVSLLERVESLLHAYDGANSFLESPPGPVQLTAVFPPAPEAPGTMIGPYKLMEQIGEGGMGVVYVAEQHQPVRRKVALKIIKPGMDTKQVIARFEAERQALALMDHPNIAKVFDGGVTESGRPYFVMELVRGLPITEYCDAERLPIRDRLELFVLVCRAVQHAHQKGVIHRDLKPSNILVTLHDGVPVPKVIDFGVAKATGSSLTEKTVYTAFTQLIGTPLYMSPEQVELSGLDVDTRSDIYSLGVLLYELLTGTTPFDSETLTRAAFDEMRRIIREEDPPKPSTRLSNLGASLTMTSAKRSSDARQLNRSVRGELDWIAMKALEKDRRRRYETANDFAADLMRYLTDQPVAACPPSRRYRLTKYARRHRAMLATVCLICMTLTLSLVGLSVGLVQITRERNRAVLLQRQAEERARWILLEVTRMDEETWQLSNIRLEPWQRQFIERVMAIVEKYAREFGDDGAARYETALILLRLGRVHYNLGQFEVADTHFRRALPLWEALAKAYPNNPDCLLHLAGCLMNVGNAEYLLRNPRDGGPYYRRALHLYEHITDRFPGYPLQQQLDLADCLAANGRVFERSGEPDQAEACYRRALIILLRLPAEPMLQHQYLYLTRMLSQSCQNLDSVLSTTDRPDEIDRVHGETLVQLEAMGPVSSEMRAIVLNKWAWSLLTRADVRSRNPRRAIELARLASELKSPDDAESWLMHGLGLEQTGDLQGAEGAFHRGIELGGDRPVNVLNAFAWQLVSEPSFRTVRPTWAVQMAERAVMLKSKRAAVWNTLGVARYRARDWPAAIQALEKSHSLSEDGHLGVNAFPMAMAYWQLGETTNARDWYENAVEWMEKKSIREGEVQRFRVEAEALLGITAQQSPREKPLP